LARRIWEQLKNAHAGKAQVQARLFATYLIEYDNFTHLPDESIDAMFQRFTLIVNNMRANVAALPYDDHDRAIKLLHSLDHTVQSEKVVAILESEKYETLTVDELFSKLKSSEVNLVVRTKIENPIDPNVTFLRDSSLLFYLVSVPYEEFKVLSKEDLALLSRRFEGMYTDQKNAQRSSGMCY
jgi:hypothetical protein